MRESFYLFIWLFILLSLLRINIHSRDGCVYKGRFLVGCDYYNCIRYCFGFILNKNKVYLFTFTP